MIRVLGTVRLRLARNAAHSPAQPSDNVNDNDNRITRTRRLARLPILFILPSLLTEAPARSLGDARPAMPLPSYPHPHAALQQAYHRLSNVFLHSYPVRDLPLNIRPVRIGTGSKSGSSRGLDVMRDPATDSDQAVIFATAAWLILLGILGMAPFPTLPINDKAMHFFGVSRSPRTH
jgi:hypothetical protein